MGCCGGLSISTPAEVLAAVINARAIIREHRYMELIMELESESL